MSLLSGLVVIDEIQRAPNLFPILPVLIDRVDNNLEILILGSASRDLLQQSTDQPRITKSVTRAIEALNLDEVYIVYPGDKNFVLERNISVLGMQALNN